MGWKGIIEITKHGLSQKHLHQTNKFIQIANKLDIKLENLEVPKSKSHSVYWNYETQGEKLATIFIHIVVENFTQSYSIFENHAGCEKGYFMASNGEKYALSKYNDKDAYKAGDKSQIIFIPDLVLLDIVNTEVITIEGKKYVFRQNGINELKNYDSFDKKYLQKYYPKFKIVRTVVLYGSDKNVITEIEVGFLLNEKGELVLGIKAPKLFNTAIKNLFEYWNGTFND